ncbi:MAG: Asp23/Gls24 family envelope stress response protein [Phascolarctobacterium sp.]|nr:Asp23/Gls24 family envelope stress response protein [Phascolarctobacterium sp.]
MKHDLDQLPDVELHQPVDTDKIELKTRADRDNNIKARLEQDRVKHKDAKASDELEENNDLEEYGDIRIADEVICIVASLAAQEVPGVISMSGGLTDGINRFLGKENASKGVRLKFEGKTVNASVYINIEYGYCIPEIALEVQEKVKEAIEAMTGYEVQFVDVNVEGVAKRQTTELEKEASSDEAMAEILRAQARRAEATEVNSFEQQLAGLRNHADDQEEDEEAEPSGKPHNTSAPKVAPIDLFTLPPEDEDMDERHKRFFEEDL